MHSKDILSFDQNEDYCQTVKNYEDQLSQIQAKLPIKNEILDDTAKEVRRLEYDLVTLKKAKVIKEEEKKSPVPLGKLFNYDRVKASPMFTFPANYHLTPN